LEIHFFHKRESLISKWFVRRILDLIVPFDGLNQSYTMALWARHGSEEYSKAHALVSDPFIVGAHLMLGAVTHSFCINNLQQ
jgi:hypothetical protein